MAQSCWSENQSGSLIFNIHINEFYHKSRGRAVGSLAFSLHCWRLVRWAPLPGWSSHHKEQRGRELRQETASGDYNPHPPDRQVENRILLHVSSMINDFLSVWKPSTFGEGGSRLQMAEVEAGCSGLNCVSPKFTCWNPNPQYLWMWLYLEIWCLK